MNFVKSKKYLFNDNTDSINTEQTEKGEIPNSPKGSIKLFNGTIGLKEPRGSVVIEKGKENNLVELLKQLGKSQCINIKETVYKDEISKTFKLDPSGHYFMTDNGDIIQGIEYQKPDKLQLSVTKPKTAKAA